MRKRVFNKWFFLAALLTISFSALSFMAYKEARSVGTVKCYQNTFESKQNEETMIEALSGQFASFISIP